MGVMDVGGYADAKIVGNARDMRDVGGADAAMRRQGAGGAMGGRLRCGLARRRAARNGGGRGYVGDAGGYAAAKIVWGMLWAGGLG